jgi:putative ubiquitin-RnfH superfamily antitoxin RatB of RatAB toxin-antitoxin module
VFGVRATGETVLRDGDRLELLRPLLADPKDARRRRAEAKTKTRP